MEIPYHFYYPYHGRQEIFWKMVGACVDSLLRGKGLSDSDVESLEASLVSKKVAGTRPMKDCSQSICVTNWLSTKE